MKMRIISLLGVVILHVAVARSEQVTQPPNTLSSIRDSINSFSHKFVQAVVEDPTKNLVSSPLSVHIVLSMLTFGARGNTEKELRSVLGLPEGDVTEREMQSLVDGFNKCTEVDVRLANSIFLADTLKPKTAFMNVTKRVFRSKARTVDFTNSVAASKTINQWCKKKTANRIKDLIRPRDLDENTRLVLVNAVYFNGRWLHEFRLRSTTRRSFHLNNGNIKSGTIDNDGVSMLIILPNKLNGLVELVKNFGIVNIAEAFKSGSQKVDLHLPKFRIESTIDLQATIGKLGLAGIFENAANFSGIADKPMQVGKAGQKAFIKVHESGTEAAAATYVLMREGFAGPSARPVDFDVDRPFLSIIATQSGQPLFVSVVNDPNY